MVLGLVVICAPLIAGAFGSLWVADEAIGPLITLVVWLAIFVHRAVRSRGSIYFIEWLAVAGSLVMLQLLLDLHTAHLGDVIIVALHAGFVIALAISALARKCRTRSTARPSASSDENVDENVDANVD